LLLGASLLAGLVAWGLAHRLSWPPGLVGLLLQNGLSAGLAIGVFGVLATLAGVPEIHELMRLVRRRPA
jgi:putative peptidoglycan lipid II flippase